MTIEIRRFSSAQSDFAQQMDSLLSWESVSDAGVQKTVADIIYDIRTRGDEALIEFTNKFDRMEATSMAELELNQEQLQAALDALPQERREALLKAAERVRSYHEKQKQDSWTYTEADGTMLGQKVTPMDRVGLYVPGGKAA